MAIIFAVTGVSQANALVTDIQDGYFDRLLLTPIRRVALLLGLMVADLVLVMALTMPVLVLGFAYGVRFETGVLGVLAFIVLVRRLGRGVHRLPVRHRAEDRATPAPSPAASSCSSRSPSSRRRSCPKEALSGWLSAVATVNPVTYLLEGLRALVTDGWVAADLGAAVLAVVGVGVVSMGLALATLRGRVKRG